MKTQTESHTQTPAARCITLIQCPLLARALGVCGAVAISTLATLSALANGGPFVLKYPGGDPAAKRVLARLDPALQPTRESRLQVVKENLTIRFEPEAFGGRMVKSGDVPIPLAAVSAEYFITNTTSESVEVDFGFPILRGIYINPFSMMPMPDAQVRVDGTNYLRPALISNSAIYGILRRNAVETIHRQLQANQKLQELFQTVHSAPQESRTSARRALAEYVTGQLKWPSTDAALLVEYAALKPADDPAAVTQTSGGESPPAKGVRHTGFFWWDNDASLIAAKNETGWAVNSIGEQKATQWLTRLAGLLDPSSASSYEAIFQSWGGDVRERSADLQTGRVRPREISLQGEARPEGYSGAMLAHADPTVYARVDYFTDDKSLTAKQKTSWQAVLKQLPVVFTFAPMNLLHYRVTFAPGAVRNVTVSYRQYAYLDTRAPRSYQVAYVVHPASLWESFGPIHLTVSAPEGVIPVGSVALREGESGLANAPQPVPGRPALRFASHVATLSDKTGELFVGINAEEWAKAVPAATPISSPGKQVSSR